MKVAEEEEEAQALQREEALNNLPVRLSDRRVASSPAASSLAGGAPESVSAKGKKGALTLSEDGGKGQEQGGGGEIRRLGGSGEDVFMSGGLGS